MFMCTIYLYMKYVFVCFCVYYLFVFKYDFVYACVYYLLVYVYLNWWTSKQLSTHLQVYINICVGVYVYV